MTVEELMTLHELAERFRAEHIGVGDHSGLRQTSAFLIDVQIETQRVKAVARG